MVKYYFFQVCRETNAQGENRTVLHSLEGQTTYEDRSNPDAPIIRALKVQLCNPENSKAVRLPVGAIVGVMHEGCDAKQCKLTKYSRNGVYFYRTEKEIFLVSFDSEENYDFIQRAPEAMLLAYSDLRGHNNGSNETAEQGAQESASDSEIQIAPQMRVDWAELDAIENHLLSETNGRDALNKLLMISQIRDRMRGGVAKFSFTKTNGDVRIAYGTRNRDLITRLLGHNDTDERGRDNHDGAHFHYFDVQKRAWRCFCTEEILNVNLTIHITNIETVMTIANTSAA